MSCGRGGGGGGGDGGGMMVVVVGVVKVLTDVSGDANATVNGECIEC